MGIKIAWGRSVGFNLELQTMQVTERIFDGPDCYTWREVFAWLPVKTVSGKIVWMKRIYKQRYWAVWGTNFHMTTQVEYAEFVDILGQDYDVVK